MRGTPNSFQSAPDYSHTVRFVVFGDQDIGKAVVMGPSLSSARARLGARVF